VKKTTNNLDIFDVV